MGNLELRQLVDQEQLDTMYDLNSYAFRPSPPMPERSQWMEYARQRKNVTYFSMLEDGRAVTGAGSTPMTEHIRGMIAPVGAIWGVASHPEVRRKGYVRQTMAAILAADRDSGKVFSTLYPFRESFYERLGYVTFPLALETHIATSNLLPLLKKDLGGEVVLKPYIEVYDLFRAFLFQLQPSIEGMAVFDDSNLSAPVRFPLWAALAYVDGKLDGFMLYQTKGDDVTTLNAHRFYYLSSRGRSLLLAWIARHVDQTEEAIINLAPYERPETWLVDIRAKTSTRARGAPMGRVLDVARLGGLKTGEGSFSVKVSDPLCPWNEGTWLFETQHGQLQVSRSNQAAGELSIQAIAALVYGSIDPQDFWLHGWGNPNAELQTSMRKMFPALVVHLHEEF